MGLRVVIGVLLVLHGIIHGILAVIPNPDAPKPVAATFFSHWARPWLQRILSTKGVQTLSILMAVLAGVGFLAAGLAMFDLLLPHDWWRALSVAASVVSVALCALYWHTYLIAGPAVAVGVIVALVLLRWPTETILGY
jgi:hypothetical protein